VAKGNRPIEAIIIIESKIVWKDEKVEAVHPSFRNAAQIIQLSNFLPLLQKEFYHNPSFGQNPPLVLEIAEYVISTMAYELNWMPFLKTEIIKWARKTRDAESKRVLRYMRKNKFTKSDVDKKLIKNYFLSFLKKIRVSEYYQTFFQSKC